LAFPDAAGYDVDKRLVIAPVGIQQGGDLNFIIFSPVIIK
jgi:hypothetical protein